MSMSIVAIGVVDVLCEIGMYECMYMCILTLTRITNLLNTSHSSFISSIPNPNPDISWAGPRYACLRDDVICNADNSALPNPASMIANIRNGACIER